MNKRFPLQSWIAILLAAGLSAPVPMAAQVFRAPVGSVAAPAALGAAPAGLSLQPLAAPGVELPAGLSIQPVGALDSIAPVQALPAPGGAQGAVEAPSSEQAPTPAASAAEGSASSVRAISEIAAEKPAAKGGFGWGRLAKWFDGGKSRGEVAGFRKAEPRSQVDSVVLDAPPALPKPVGRVGSWLGSVIGHRGRRIETSRFNLFQAQEAVPVINADPADAAAVEAGLRAYVDANPKEFKGVGSKDLSTVYVRRVEGKAGASDTVYAFFVQSKDNVPVEGSKVSFTLKTVGGKLTIMSSRSTLYPQLAVQTATSYTDEQLGEMAQSRLGRTPQSGQGLMSLGRAIKFIGGKWRSVQVYTASDIQVMVAVDVASGETFAWDSRVHMNPMDGQATGRGTAEGPWSKDAELTAMTLPHLKVDVEGADSVYTDDQGRFTVPGDGSKPVKIKARLEGRYAKVEDQSGKDLVVAAEAVPGQTLQIVFNPQGKEEFATAQVNAYKHVSVVHDWLKERGITDKGLDIAITIKANVDDECNAYYTPGSPSLNFFRGSKNCANTSFASVAYHEYGHFVHDTIGGITDGGLSEGWGDILSMYITGAPEIGKGFLLNPGDGKSWIRDGNNDYKLDPSGEVHDQGQAWMGFAWLLRKALSAADPSGTALAEHLVLPVFYSKPGTIPEAVQEVLLRDVDANGNIPHLEQIKAAAEAHGLKVTPPGKKRGGLALSWAKQLSGFIGLN